MGKAKFDVNAARQARTFRKLAVFAIQYGGSGDVSPDGVQGQSPLHQFIPKLLSIAERGERAAQPPRPQGAGFRRKRAPRGAWTRLKAGEDAARQARAFYKLTVFAIQYGGSGDVSPDGVQGQSPAKGTCPPTGRRGGAPRRGRVPPTGCRGGAPRSSNAYKVSSPPVSNLP